MSVNIARMKVQTKCFNSLSSLGCLTFSLRSSFFQQVCSLRITPAQTLHMGRWEANASEPQQQIFTALVHIRSVLCEVRRNNRVEQWTQPLLKCLKNLQTNDSQKVLCHSGLFPVFFSN